MKIENYGTGERCAEAMRLLIDRSGKESTPGVERVILLPIPSTRDGVHLFGSEITLSDILRDVGVGDLVLGYSIPDSVAEYITSRGACLCDAARDEEFLDENARLTAIGTLEYLLTVSSRAPQDLTVGIIGYGRIGGHLARILLFLGAKIIIYTSKNLTRVELGALGVENRGIDYSAPDLGDTDALDVLINTAPTRLDGCFPDGKIPPTLEVIELASGNNFGGVVGVVKLPSVPERSYPKSAGQAYFRAAQRYMRGDF